MRKRYDYSGFRLSRIHEPRFAHVKLWGTWLIYFVLHFLTENLIPAESCHPMHCIVDDWIPFHEYWAVFYIGWYFLVTGSLVYYFFYDVKRFRELELYIFFTQIAATACYILYPSRQDMRPEVFSRNNVFTWILGRIYLYDTNTGVCPSLHVVYSLAILSVVWKDKNIRKRWKVLLLILVIAISLSTNFVKQHSFLDVLAAVVTALLGEYQIYHNPFWKNQDKDEMADSLR